MKHVICKAGLTLKDLCDKICMIQLTCLCHFYFKNVGNNKKKVHVYIEFFLKRYQFDPMKFN